MAACSRKRDKEDQDPNKKQEKPPESRRQLTLLILTLVLALIGSIMSWGAAIWSMWVFFPRP